MSYMLETQRPQRLESPRPRSPLPPLRIRSSISSYAPSSPTTLLYDLPQSSSRSPPPSAVDPSPFVSPLKSPPPSSPTYARHRGRTRATPPPGPRSRSSTPAQVARQELDQFAAHCHAWFFEQDERAGQLMTQTMESLSASQRAPFARLQASIRSSYHTTMAKRRKTEFRAHLSSTHPGGSLLPRARAHPFGKDAQKERYRRFAKFIQTWCIDAMPGTRPFFKALWALMRLQILPVTLGGAGDRRIEWELDDAVFQESAGKDFMLEAIDVLKGVLGFEEYLPVPSRRQSEEIYSPTAASTPIPSRPPLTRPRSPSDPFLDTPALSHSVTTSASQSSTSATHIPLSQLVSDEITPQTADFPPPARTTPPPGRSLQYMSYKDPPDTNEGESLHDEPYLRLWTSADLDNPEWQSLISLFPDHISRQSLPRFGTPQQTRGGGREADLEEGLAEDPREVVSCGTGRMWVGDKERREGWRGNWWHRLTGWWRRLFC